MVPTIHYMRGKGKPDENNKVYLSNEINGIEDLETQTLMVLEVKGESMTWVQLDEGLKSKLIINENGIREIEIENYYEGNGEVAWSIIWIRKNYL